METLILTNGSQRFTNSDRIGFGSDNFGLVGLDQTIFDRIRFQKITNCWIVNYLQSIPKFGVLTWRSPKVTALSRPECN
jgi:hypothetical protein